MNLAELGVIHVVKFIWLISIGLSVISCAQHHVRTGAVSELSSPIQPEPLAAEQIPWNRFLLAKLAADEAEVLRPSEQPLPRVEVVQNFGGRFFGTRWIRDEESIHSFAAPGDIYVAYNPVGLGDGEATRFGFTSMDEVGIVVRNGDSEGSLLFPDSRRDALCRVTLPRERAGCDWPRPAHIVRYLAAESSERSKPATANLVAALAHQLFLSDGPTGGLSHGERLRIVQSWHGAGSPYASSITGAHPVFRSSDLPAALYSAVLGTWLVRPFEISQVMSLAQRSSGGRTGIDGDRESLKRFATNMIGASLLSLSPNFDDIKVVSNYLEQLAHIAMYEPGHVLAQGKYDRVLGAVIYPFNYVRDAFDDGHPATGRLHYIASFEPHRATQLFRADQAAGYKAGYVGHIFGAETPISDDSSVVQTPDGVASALDFAQNQPRLDPSFTNSSSDLRR